VGRPFAAGQREGVGVGLTARHRGGVAALAVAKLLGDGLDADMRAVVAIREAPLAAPVDGVQGGEVTQGEVG